MQVTAATADLTAGVGLGVGRLLHRQQSRSALENWMRIYGWSAAPPRTLEANFGTAREPVALKS